MTNDISTFSSDNVTTPQRPTGVVVIAGREYEMRCPKLRVWMSVIERQEDYDSGQALKPHIQEIYRKLTAKPDDEERDKLLQQLGTMQPVFGQAPTVLQLAAFFLDFLASCMVEPSEGRALSEAYNSDDGDVDIPHLRRALDDLEAEFEHWLDEQADFVGVVRPELPERSEIVANRADRRASAPRQRTDSPAAAKRSGGSKRAAAKTG